MTKLLFNKTVSIVLSVILIFSVLPFGFSVQAAASNFTVTIDTGASITLKDSDGDGFYEISTADELYAFAQKVNSNSRSIKGKLMNDIVFNENVVAEMSKENPDISGFRRWYSIGWKYSMPYNGEFDGNGKTVSGLYNDSTNDEYNSYVGMFGSVETSEYNSFTTTIKNLRVTDSYFNGDYGIGAIVGYLNSGLVDNCSSSNNIILGNYDIGGVAGINEGSVKNCYSSTSFDRESCYIGGIAGYNLGSIENCYNTADIKGTYYIGGITGWSRNCYGVENCYNIGDIEGSSYYIGGIAGINSDDSSIINCYNIGNIKSGDYGAGGIAGSNDSIVNNCYSSGTVIANSSCGDIIGNNYRGTLTNSSAKTDAQFASGEVACLLQQGVSAVDGVVPQIWGQNIDNGKANEGRPVFSDAKVNYGYVEISCAEISPYTNKAIVTTERLEHQYEDAVCTVCTKECLHIDSTSYFSNGEDNHSLICTVCKYILETVGHNFVNGICDKCNEKKDYKVTVSNSIQNGTVTVDKVITNVGEAVTLSYEADKGFELKKITVTYGDGNTVDVTDNTFIMPASDVTVRVEFTQICFHIGNTNTGDYYDHHSFTCKDCGKVIEKEEHYGGKSNCHEYAKCVVCGDEYAYLDRENHTGEFAVNFEWYQDRASDSCYATAELICYGCEYAVDYVSDYAEKIASAPATDCMHKGYETWRFTAELDGVEYTETKTYEIKSDNHTGTFNNGFCSNCGGFEAATDSNEDGFYEIDNAGKLFWFADYINNVYNELYAILTDDIVIPSDKIWTPIFNFYGTFDGNFKTISGLYYITDGNYAGLFGGGYYSYGTVKNLHVANSTFEGDSYVGAIAGYFAGTVENCYVDSSVTVKGNYSVGALLGDNAGVVRNCYAYAEKAIGYYNSDYTTVENVYYLSDTDDGNGGKTKAQFESGEVAYLLQSGIVGEWIYNEKLGEYTELEPAKIWGQNIGYDLYPVFGEKTVYKVVVTCNTEKEQYSNSAKNLNHNFVNGICSYCSAIEMDYNNDGKLNILDLVRLKKYLADKTTDIDNNADDDGVIEAADLVKIRKLLLK